MPDFRRAHRSPRRIITSPTQRGPQNSGLFESRENEGIHETLDSILAPWELFGSWIREVVGAPRDIVVAMDWTDFDADNQATLALHLVTRQARATPLPWLSVDKDELKNQRNDFEDLRLSRLKALLPKGTSATILADRVPRPIPHRSRSRLSRT